MKAVIFDLDGLLVDSEIHWHTAVDLIWQKHGVERTLELDKKLIGLNLFDTIKVINEFNPTLTLEELTQSFDDAANTIYGEQCQLMPGAANLIANLRAQNVPIGLGSSSSIDWINAALERLQIRPHFSALVSTRSHKLPGKPNPDVYIEAARQLGVMPSEVIVFEDTIIGATAGKRAGAFVVGVPQVWSYGDFSVADVILESLADFDFSLIK